MAMNGPWGIVLAAFGVFAVTLALFVTPSFSSEAFLQWVTTTAPCGAGT